MKGVVKAGLALCAGAAITLQAVAQEGVPPAEPAGREGPRIKAGQPRGGMLEGREGRMEGRMGGDGAMIARLLTNPKVAEELGLSQEQIKSLQEKLDALRKEIATLNIDLESSSMEQARLLTAQKVDESAVMSAVEKAGDLRTKIAKLMVQQMLTVKKILTPEQVEKARAMMRERMEKARGQGEGGDKPKFRRFGDRGTGDKEEGGARRPEKSDRGERSAPPPPPQNPM